MKKAIGVLGLSVILGLGANSAMASIDCELDFSMSGWSAFYKTASGSGTIRCNNGQTMKVNIRTKGGGITFGKQRIDNGRGKFSEVNNIKDLLGSYASGGAHAGAVKSSAASVVTKGDVSLALAGTGEGIDIGVDFGKFVISRR